MRIGIGVQHGYAMRLDMGDRFERATYYLGSFYEAETQALIKQLLRPGDTYIDVGANIGQLCLCAARVLQDHGTILAFEPNPEARARLIENITMNNLRCISVHGLALGDTAGHLVLSMPTTRSGQSTLRTVLGARRTFQVRVASLDDFCSAMPEHGRVFLKVDTEGYDFRVLKGARRLLTRSDICVLAEVNDAWLAELGESAQEMFAYMQSLGFHPLNVRLHARFLRRTLRCEPLALPGPHHWYNAFFAREDLCRQLGQEPPT